MKPSFFNFNRFFKAVSVVRKTSNSVFHGIRRSFNSLFSFGFKLAKNLSKRAYITYLKFLMWAGADMNKTYPTGHTLLTFATHRGDTEMVKVLLKHNRIDVNKINEIVDSALISAVRHGHTEIVKELLKHRDINVNIKNNLGGTALIIAIHNGHTEIVKELLKHRNTNANIINDLGETALILAARNGHTEIVKELLKHRDINVNIINNLGETALIIAIHNGHTEIVKELLKHEETDVNKTTHFGNTPLNFAAKHGHTEIVQELLKHKKIYVNKKNSIGDTVLFFAAVYGHIGVVRALLAWEKTPTKDFILEGKVKALSNVCKAISEIDFTAIKPIISELIINAMNFDELNDSKKMRLSEDIAKAITNKIDKIVNLDIAPSLKAHLGNDPTSVVLDYFLPHAASKKTKKEAQSEENQPEEAEPVIRPRP